MRKSEFPKVSMEESQMAFIYMAGGWELNAHEETRDSLTEKMAQAADVLPVQLMFPHRVGTRQAGSVTLAVRQIAVVSDQQLPRAGLGER
jgi:hypothetical protein